MEFDKGKGRALVIGIARYSNVSDLPESVLNDAKDIGDLLRSPDHCGYPEDGVRLLLDERATADGIREGLRWLADAADPDGTALVFFSGHGGQIPKGPDGINYLIPYDCDLTRLTETAISDAELTGLLRHIKPPRLLCILDSCHAGGTGDVKDLVFKSGFSEDFYARLAQGRGRVVMASSRPDEVSWAPDDLKNSLFTHYLLEALHGKARTRGDGLIRVFDLIDHVSELVPAHARRDQAQQHPVFKALLENNFPVALYQGGKQLGAGAVPPLRTSVNTTELRKAMVRAFDLEELKLLCADIEQDLANDGMWLDVPLKWDTIEGTTRQSKSLNLIEFLHRRRYLAYLVRAVRHARPGII